MIELSILASCGKHKMMDNFNYWKWDRRWHKIID